MADLYSRLKAARERTRSGTTGEAGGTLPSGSPAAGDAAPSAGRGGAALNDRAPGPGWQRLEGGLWYRELLHSLDRRAGERFDGDPAVWRRPSTLLAAPRGRVPVFVDIETSGMGGSGSIAFLVGIGVIVADERVRVRVRQWFASDLGCEPALVAHVIAALAAIPDPLYVTYNGASFDLPVLRGRCIMARTRFPEHPHLDLLPLTRRLYRSVIGSCTLSRVEAQVLGLTRSEDVPSHEVPTRYLEFVKGGVVDLVTPVASHHSYDVAHLAVLLVTLDQQCSLEPASRSALDREMETNRGGGLGASAAGVPADRYGLAKLLLERGGETGPQLARELLMAEASIAEQRAVAVRRTLSRLAVHRRRAQAGGGATRGRYGSEGERAGGVRSGRWCAVHELLLVAAHRSGDESARRAAAAALWRHRGEERDAHELAKVLEHSDREFASALEVVTDAAERHGWSSALARRAHRLQRKRESNAT